MRSSLYQLVRVAPPNINNKKPSTINIHLDYRFKLSTFKRLKMFLEQVAALSLISRLRRLLPNNLNLSDFSFMSVRNRLRDHTKIRKIIRLSRYVAMFKQQIHAHFCQELSSSSIVICCQPKHANLKTIRLITVSNNMHCIV